MPKIVFIGEQVGDAFACRLVGFHRKPSPKVFDVETSNIASGNIDALVDGRTPRHHSPSMQALEAFAPVMRRPP